MAEVSIKRCDCVEQLVVFFGSAGIGTRVGWGADAVLRACCKVVCRPRGTDQQRGRVVLVNEHRTSQVSYVVSGQQPCREEPCEACKLEAPRLLRPAWSHQRDQPVLGLMWCPVVAPHSQAATQAAASEPGRITPPPAKRTKAEQAAEPTQPTQHTKAG
ncbi:hypothetical protein QJQ45_002003 [Haematococcus lacustris]|nr:hypothetical protein QJQ45_002003 [Haematococcus lacustris]